MRENDDEEKRCPEGQDPRSVETDEIVLRRLTDGQQHEEEQERDNSKWNQIDDERIREVTLQADVEVELGEVSSPLVVGDAKIRVVAVQPVAEEASSYFPSLEHEVLRSLLALDYSPFAREIEAAAVRISTRLDGAGPEALEASRNRLSRFLALIRPQLADLEERLRRQPTS